MIPTSSSSVPVAAAVAVRLECGAKVNARLVCERWWHAKHINVYADDDGEHKGLKYRSVIVQDDRPTHKTRKSTVVHGSQLWPRTTERRETYTESLEEGSDEGEEDGTGIRKHSPG